MHTKKQLRDCQQVSRQKGTILDLCWPFYVHFYVHDETKLDLNHSIFIPVSNNLPQKVFGDLVIFFTD